MKGQRVGLKDRARNFPRLLTAQGLENPTECAGSRMFWKVVRSPRHVPEMVKVEPSRWTPRPILPSMIEEFRAKAWMWRNASVMSVAEVYSPEMMYSKYIIEEGTGTVSS